MTDEHGLAKLFLEQRGSVTWAVDQKGAFYKFYSDPSCVRESQQPNCRIEPPKWP